MYFITESGRDTPFMVDYAITYENVGHDVLTYASQMNSLLKGLPMS